LEITVYNLGDNPKLPAELFMVALIMKVTSCFCPLAMKNCVGVAETATPYGAL
jgi:hypothetical protein